MNEDGTAADPEDIEGTAESTENAVVVGEPVAFDGSARVEPVGATGKVLVWECSLGDFNSRVEQEVIDHVASHEKPKKAAPAAKPARRGTAAKKA